MAQLDTAVQMTSPERIACRWVEAFNARDLAGMLACLDRGVAFFPVRLSGIESCYRGHAGVRCWFDQLRRHDYAFTISLSDVQDLGDGRVCASGSLSLCEDRDIVPFCGLHRVANGVTISAHHYLSDREMIEQLGLLRS
jgi:SnoaL-like domain